MSDIWARPSRPLEEFGKDLADLTASSLPESIVRDNFERRRDEANAIAPGHDQKRLSGANFRPRFGLTFRNDPRP
jgi:hypothetical protein